MKKTQAIFVLCLIFVLSAGVGIGAVVGISQLSDKNTTPELNDNGGVIVSDNTNNVSIDSKKENLDESSKINRSDKENGASKGQSKDQVVINAGGSTGDIVLKPQNEEIVIGDEITTSTTNEVNTEEQSTYTKIGIPPTIKIGDNISLVTENKPLPNPDTRTYTYNVKAMGGVGGLTYHLYAARNAKDTLSNRTGNFVNVPYVSGGKYILLVVDARGNAFKKDITGFVFINQQLSTAELTRRLSKATPDRSMESYFASGYKMQFTGLKSGDPRPTNYTSIYSNISSEYWKSVRVTEVEYNDYNKITKITISVTYNNY